MVEKKKTIVLFDVDGTLTEARKTVKPDMVSILKKLRGSEYKSAEHSDGSLRDVDIGVVGGSDLDKQREQLGPETLKMFDYNFAENGVVAYKAGEPLASTSITEFLGEERIKKFINFVLHYIADLDIPVKRGTFIEYRTGMLNVSCIGRNCSREERNEYEKYDLEHKVREKFVAKLREEFKDYGLTYSIGGQISFDVFPNGWDKTFCLQYLKDTYDEVHFFGDKTFKGGNDFEIFSHPEVKGHTVTSPEDTIKQLGEIFGVKA